MVVFFLHDKRSGFSFADDLKIALRQLISFDKTEAVVLGGLIAGVMVLGMLTIRDRWARVRLRRADGLFCVGLCGAILYVVAPDALFGGGLIRERLLIYVVLVLILWVAAQNYGRMLSWLITAGATAVSLVGLVINVGSYIQFNDYLQEQVAAGEFMTPQTTTLPIAIAYARRHEVEWFSSTAPVPLAASLYIAAGKGLVELSNYEAATDHFPTAFRPDVNPHRHLGDPEDMSTLNIAGYYPRVGKHVDYVLVKSCTGVEQDLARNTEAQRQLSDGYAVMYISPRDLARLYRRVEGQG